MTASPPSIEAEIFGLTLRHLRTQAGLSLRQLGRRALYDYTRLSRAERGEILIPPTQVRVLDDLLRAGGLVTALRSIHMRMSPAAVRPAHRDRGAVSGAPRRGQR